MGRLKFKQLVKKRYNPTRNLVISEAYEEDGTFAGYAVSNQVCAIENGKEIRLFLRGGIGIVSYAGLLNIRDALNEVIEQVETKQKK